MPAPAEIATEVDLEVIEDACTNGDVVLVERCAGEPARRVAALRT